MLFGSKSAVALSESVDRKGYRVVGEMYLHGVINGEGMRGKGEAEDVCDILDL